MTTLPLRVARLDSPNGAHSSVSQLLLRSAVLGYLLLSWIAIEPFSQVPLLSKAQAFATKQLRTVSLVPGMAVFRGQNTGDFAAHDSCLEVFAYGKDGRRALYSEECPYRGTRSQRDPLKVALLHMTLMPEPSLLRPPLPPPSQASASVRSVIAMGDYFCHLEPGVERVVMRRVEYWRNMSEGGPAKPEEQLICKQQCGAQYTPPECRLRRSEALKNAVR